MERIVISVGGSIIAPNGVDVEYIKKLKELILKSDKKFVLVIGGGKIARDYVSDARKIADIDDLRAHWIGIMSTRINAELVKAVFMDDAYDEVVIDPTKELETDKKVVVGAGYEPGYSSDMDAVLLAKNCNAQTIINLTNVDHVYDCDPRESDDAKPFTAMTYKEFEDIFGQEFSPGQNAPFDPLAAIKAREFGKDVIVMNGQKLDRLTKYLFDGSVEGTIIKN